MTTTQLTGSFTALVTPFSADGSAIDFTRLDEAIMRQGLAGITGIVPCGTTGETPALTEVEYRSVVSRSIDAARREGLQVIPGAGANCTTHAIDMHRFVADAGADAALHVAPYYNKPSQAGLYRHFMAIADSCDLPIVVYNIPGRTGVTIEAATLSRLAEHPNITAVKDATGSLELAQRAVFETDLTVLSGDDPMTLPMMSIGGSGVISVAGNVVPHLVAALVNAMKKGDLAEARRHHDTIAPLARTLLTVDTNPVPVKTALRLLGHDSGALRLPMCPPGEAAVEAIQDALTMTNAAAAPVAPATATA